MVHNGRMKSLRTRFKDVNVTHFCAQFKMSRKTVDRIKTDASYKPSALVVLALNAALDKYVPPEEKA